MASCQATVRRRMPRLIGSTLVGATGLALIVGLLPTAGHADTPKTSAQIQREIDSLEEKASIAVEDYNDAEVKLEESKSRSAATDKKIKEAQAKIGTMQQSMGAFAAAAYRAGTLGDMAALLTAEDGAAFVSRAATLDVLTSRRSDQMRDLTAAQNTLAQSKLKADQEVVAQEQLRATIASRKQQIDRILADQQKLLSSVKASERAAMERAAAEKAAKARAAALKAANERASRASMKTAVDAKSMVGVPASGRVSAALAYAQAQLGKPYRWAAAGPSSFDCSGLTMRAWGAAGVSLSHSSRGQYSSGRKVARSDLQPGDLVFFGRPIHHVGIYVGGGMMIHAPQTGRSVSYSSISRGDYVGAIRP